jgi:hypothetical protein
VRIPFKKMEPVIQYKKRWKNPGTGLSQGAKNISRPVRIID